MTKYAVRRKDDGLFFDGHVSFVNLDRAMLFDRVNEAVASLGQGQAHGGFLHVTRYEVVPCGLAYVPLEGPVSL